MARTTTEVVQAYVRRRPKSGATRAEIARGTGLSENTVNPRVRELIELGAFIESGVRDGRGVVVPNLNGNVVLGASF